MKLSSAIAVCLLTCVLQSAGRSHVAVRDRHFIIQRCKRENNLDQGSEIELQPDLDAYAKNRDFQCYLKCYLEGVGCIEGNEFYFDPMMPGSSTELTSLLLKCVSSSDTSLDMCARSFHLLTCLKGNVQFFRSSQWNHL